MQYHNFLRTGAPLERLHPTGGGSSMPDAEYEQVLRRLIEHAMQLPRTTGTLEAPVKTHDEIDAINQQIRAAEQSSTFRLNGPRGYAYHCPNCNAPVYNNQRHVCGA